MRDYTIWGSLFGNSEIDEEAMDADASGNGEIDAADYVVWRHAVERTASINVSVPEPATILANLIALVAALSGRRNRCGRESRSTKSRRTLCV